MRFRAKPRSTLGGMVDMSVSVRPQLSQMTYSVSIRR